MKVLILYASYGGGHQKAAEALKEYYEKYHPDYELMYLDAMKYTSPDLNDFILKFYVQLSTNTPKAWGRLYDLSDQYTSLTDFTTLLSKAVARKFLKLVADFNPDIVICTHPFAIDMLGMLKKRKKINPKIGLILTDYAPHQIWISNPNIIDAYFVATDIMEEELRKASIDEDKIFVTGIPTLEAFHQKHNREKILEEFDLNDNTFTILFFPGGEYGLAKNSSTFEDILRLPNVQVITIAGKNEKLKKSFEKIAKNYSKKVVVLGYTNKVPDILDLADLVITKPGGLTTTESIVSITPIVITAPIPGQEEHNSNYILNNGLGFRLFNNVDKFLTLKHIISNKKRLEQVKEMQKLLAKPHAAKDICEIMVNLKKE